MSRTEEISDIKRKYLESIGIDIDNLPENFEQISESMDNEYTSEMRQYIESPAAEISIKQFSLGDVIGTNHPDYYNKSWIDSFIATKRGDRIVEEYYKNPSYYSEFLKQPNQDNYRVHETPLELYENNGKFYINGGNNRIAFIMMQYLKEMSEAKSDEEKQAINEKYTFYGEVRSMPRDKDLVYLVNYIRDKLGYHVRNGGEEGHYICEKAGETTVEVSSKEEIYDFIREKLLTDISSPSLLLREIALFKNAANIPRECKQAIIPDYEPIVDIYMEIEGKTDLDTLLEGYDYKKAGFGSLKKTLEDEKSRLDTEKQEESKRRQEEEENRRKDEEKKLKQKELAKRREEEKRAQQEKARREEAKRQIAKAKRQTSISKSEKSLPIKIARDYSSMRDTQSLYMSMAEKLNMDPNSFQVIDNRQLVSDINKLNKEMSIAAKRVDQISNESDLSSIEQRLEQVQSLFAQSKLPQEFQQEMAAQFASEFGKKINDVIKNDKLNKLQVEYQNEIQKKFGIIGRITGKKRLHDEKLKNILLRQKLIKLEYDEKNPRSRNGGINIGFI